MRKKFFLLIFISLTIIFNGCTLDKNKTDVQDEKPDNLFAEKISKGLNFYINKDYNSAINLYNQAIEVDPQNISVNFAYKNRGDAYFALKNYNAAISDYNKVIEKTPNDYKSYYQRGSAYLYLENYNEAIEDFTKAIQYYPNNIEASNINTSYILEKFYIEYSYIFRGRAYFNLKNYDQAISDCTKAISMNADNYEAYVIRGRAYAILKIYNESLADFTKAIKINPNEGEAYHLRGIIYYFINQDENAKINFQKAKELGYDSTN